LGWIIADFQLGGTTPCERERLIRCVRGAEMIGAASRRNHDGSPSGPVAVGLRVSSRLNTTYSGIAAVEGGGPDLSWGEVRVGCLDIVE